MPNFIEKKITEVQSIVKFFEDPCQAPWSVYFELALAPAGHVVIELLSFGLDDIIRGYFRPKGLYRRGRTGRLARALGKYAGIPEIGEMIGAHLPGAETIKGRMVSNGVRFMWIVDGVLQRVLFWWMVVDLLTDFLYAWTSAINKTEYCQSRCTGSVTCAILPNTVLPGVWITLGPDLTRCDKSWGDVNLPPGGAPVFGRVGWTAAAVVFLPFIGVCGPGQVRLIDNQGFIYDTREATPNPDGTWSAIAAAQIPGNRVTFVQAMAGGGPGCIALLVDTTRSTMTGWAY